MKVARRFRLPGVFSDRLAWMAKRSLLSAMATDVHLWVPVAVLLIGTLVLLVVR
jgi:hypothetical protein